MSTTVAQIRTRLRAERRAADITLDVLSASSGVDRAVIHRIENVRRYQDYTPNLDTLARLIQGLGLSWTAFFARVEGVEVAGLLALPDEARRALLAMPSVASQPEETGGSRPATQKATASTTPRRQRRLS